MNQHLGSDFDDFLLDEGIYAETQSLSIKRVFAFQLRELMQQQGMTKVQLAARMETSRSALDRLLDPANTSVTLATMERAALVLGKRMRLELVA